MPRLVTVACLDCFLAIRRSVVQRAATVPVLLLMPPLLPNRARHQTRSQAGMNHLNYRYTRENHRPRRGLLATSDTITDISISPTVLNVCTALQGCRSRLLSSRLLPSSTLHTPDPAICNPSTRILLTYTLVMRVRGGDPTRKNLA